MRVTVLGSAAGGGFPQWNCACPNCSRMRAGKLRSRVRSQAQVVVSLNTTEYFLLNASPDLRNQILSTPSLAPAHSPRHTPIVGVLLTSADVDAVAGLLHLREFQPLHVYATQSVRRILHEENRIFRVLERADPPVVWHDVPLNTWLPLGLQSSHAKEDPPARFRYVPLGSTYPDYVSAELRRILPSAEAVVGIAIEHRDRRRLA